MDGPSRPTRVLSFWAQLRTRMKRTQGSPPANTVPTLRFKPTAAEQRLLHHLKQEWFTTGTSDAGIAHCVLRVALLNWPILRRVFEADAYYMRDEGFDSISQLHQQRIEALAKRGFKP